MDGTEKQECGIKKVIKFLAINDVLYILLYQQNDEDMINNLFVHKNVIYEFMPTYEAL